MPATMSSYVCLMQRNLQPACQPRPAPLQQQQQHHKPCPAHPPTFLLLRPHTRTLPSSEPATSHGCCPAPPAPVLQKAGALQ